MSVVQQIIDAITSEIRRAIRKQIHQGEVAFERYLRKMLVKVLKLLALSMMGVVLIASASVFLLMGTILYLERFMPNYLAWDVVGLISGLVGAILFLLLYIQLRNFRL
jgi:hypothetical protein